VSHRALKLAVRDEIRQRFGYQPEECELTFTGKPPNRVGRCLDERFAVNITVSVRMADIPEDQWELELSGQSYEKLDKVVERIRTIHLDPLQYSIVARANAIMNKDVGPGDGIVEPLDFLRAGPVELKSGSWWGARGEPRAGVAQTLYFGNARRLQKAEDEE